ncbi:hypothetical protein HBZS_106410 [Helicobacter bizzozeronii CCUG 35545]|nr:hypothetical protein HBZS_106410 [Helicobacter bizzozeronii CCUG 35545]
MQGAYWAISKNDCGSFEKLKEAIRKTYGAFEWRYVEIG